MGWREDMDAEIKANREAAEAKRRADQARAEALDGMFAEAFESGRRACAEFLERLGDKVKFEPLRSFLVVSDHLGYDEFNIYFDRANERIVVAEKDYRHSPVAVFSAALGTNVFVATPKGSGIAPTAFGDEVVGPGLYAWAKFHKFLD